MPSARSPRLRRPAGLVPADAADGDRGACEPSLYDVDRLAVEGRAVGQPGRAARARAPRARRRRDAAARPPRRDEPGRARHRGDARRARARAMLILAELDGARGACARLARRAPRDADGGADAAPAGGADDVRATRPPAGSRGLLDAPRARWQRPSTLAAQLGGAAGTLAALGERGPEVAAASRPSSASPSRSSRGTRTARRSPSSAAALAQRRRRAARRSGSTSCCSPRPRSARCARRRGRGGSSTMPHKRNPARRGARAVPARARAAQTALLADGEQSTSAPPARGRRRTRSRMRWRWPAARAPHARGSSTGLQVDAARMRAEHDRRAGVRAARRSRSRATTSARARVRRSRRSRPGATRGEGEGGMSDEGASAGCACAARCSATTMSTAHRAHDDVHGGLPGSDHALRLGRDRPGRARPAHAQRRSR